MAAAQEVMASQSRKSPTGALMALRISFSARLSFFMSSTPWKKTANHIALKQVNVMDGRRRHKVEVLGIVVGLPSRHVNPPMDTLQADQGPPGAR